LKEQSDFRVWLLNSPNYLGGQFTEHRPASENKKPLKYQGVGFNMVRVEGLEPPRRETPDPKSGASANSAIRARLLQVHFQQAENGEP
jgi:hypothetical protein